MSWPHNSGLFSVHHSTIAFPRILKCYFVFWESGRTKKWKKIHVGKRCTFSIAYWFGALLKIKDKIWQIKTLEQMSLKSLRMIILHFFYVQFKLRSTYKFNMLQYVGFLCTGQIWNGSWQMIWNNVEINKKVWAIICMMRQSWGGRTRDSPRGTSISHNPPD